MLRLHSFRICTRWTFLVSKPKLEICRLHFSRSSVSGWDAQSTAVKLVTRSGLSRAYLAVLRARICPWRFERANHTEKANIQEFIGCFLEISVYIPKCETFFTEPRYLFSYSWNFSAIQENLRKLQSTIYHFYIVLQWFFDKFFCDRNFKIELILAIDPNSKASDWRPNSFGLRSESLELVFLWAILQNRT